jgi:hypothetical protein
MASTTNLTTAIITKGEPILIHSAPPLCRNRKKKRKTNDYDHSYWKTVLENFSENLGVPLREG